MTGAAAAALALAEAGAVHIPEARVHRTRAAEIIDTASDEELVGHLDALYHLAWCENYLEHFDDAIGHVDRLIDVVRTADGARPLVPMLLVKCYPLEDDRAARRSGGRGGRSRRGDRAGRRCALSPVGSLRAGLGALLHG